MKKKFKVRMNCISFHDVVVLAKNKTEARNMAEKYAACPQNDMEFCEFLPVEDSDKIDCQTY